MNTGCCSICFHRDRGDDHADNPKSKWSTDDSRVFAKYGIHGNSAIRNVRDANRLFRGGNACMKETNQYLRSAYEDLRKIERELRLYDTGT